MLATLRAFSEVLLPITIVIAAGYALRRTFPLDLRTLNRMSLYVLTPSLVFATLLRTNLPGGAALQLAGQMLVVLGVSAGCGYVLASLLELSSTQRSGFLLVTTFMNSGNYGLSATRFAFGDDGFQYAIVGFLIQAIMSQTWAVYLASAGQGDRRAAFRQVFRLPVIYATLLAVGLRLLGVQLDETNGLVAVGVFRGVRLLADAALPMLLLILGMQLQNRQPLASIRPLATATMVRLGLSIPVAYGAGVFLGLSGLPLYVGVLQAAMPTAVNVTILALEFDAWPEFVNNGVIATTLASLVTLTVLIAVMR